MPRVNTNVNNSKSTENKGCVRASARVTTRNQSKKASPPAKRTRTAKPESPIKEQKNNGEKKTKGKENVRDNKEQQDNNKKGNKKQLDESAELDKSKEEEKKKVVTSKLNKRKKVAIPDKDSEDEKDTKKKIVAPKPNKRRKVAISDEDSEAEIDSGDEYKPDNDEEDLEDKILSEVDNEQSTEKDSDDETPKKKKINIRAAPAKKARKNISKKEVPLFDSEPTVAEKASDSQSWPHLKYDFLQPDKIMDSNKRTPDHPDYDPRTLYIPQDFLDKQTPVMRQWWMIKSSHYDCILFFKVGKYYKLYHMDAVIGVDELNLTYVKRDFRETGVEELQYGRESSNLIERGYKVARIEQIETPEIAAARFAKMEKRSKFDKIIKREMCQISTRGTKMYTALDTETIEPTSNYLLSIIEKQPNGLPSYGVCFIDTSIGDFHLGQFQDDRCNSRLLTLLAHYPPVQIVYERGSLSSNTLKVINSLLPSVMKEALPKDDQFKSPSKVLETLQDYFKQEDDSEIAWPTGLQPYVDDDSELTPPEEKELAVSALGGCINLLKECHLEQQLLSRGRFTTYSPPDFTGTVKQKAKRQTQFAINMVLDSITINNLRILGSDGSLIQVLDNCCTAFGKRLIREWICRPSCRKDVIIERQEAISQLLANPAIITEVRSKLSTLPDLERLLSKVHAYGNTCKLRNHPDNKSIFIYSKTINKRKIIDFVSLLTGFEEVLKIIEKFSDFTNELISKCTKLEPEGDFPDLKDKIYHFKNAFDYDQVLKSGNKKIFTQFSEEFDMWSKATHIISVLDCLISLAEYARIHDVCVPTIYDDTDKEEMMIEIKDGRHPTLMSDNFIPNDTLATGGNAPIILLTTPNMGGKSTLMRQVGLITVMAQIGCHVPASSCRLTLVDRIFTRLGANDDIMAGQSTFLVELSETAAILQHATTYSLVLLDELGRGISTYDGTAIASAVVDALTKKKCRTLFSTEMFLLLIWLEQLKMMKLN